MLFEITSSVLKYTLFGFISFIIYFVYKFIFVAWNSRRTFSKYQNVAMTKKFYPVLGDLAEIKQRMDSGVYNFYNLIDITLEGGKDMKLTFIGHRMMIDLLSIDAMEQMIKLCPKSIDRYSSENFPIWYVVRNSLLLIPSTKNWQMRRKTTTKLIGINNISSYIPMMIKCVDHVLEQHDKNLDSEIVGTPSDDTNLTVLMKRISFKIICIILFGQDIHDFEKKVDYVDCMSGEVTSVTFETLLCKLAKDIASHLTSVKGNLFPFLEKYSLIYPMKATNKNYETLMQCVRTY